jgi:type I restriction enzyme S subunit
MAQQENIPLGWVCTHLTEAIDKIVGGGTPSKAVASYYEGKIPWMTVKDMNKFRLIDTVDHISQEGINNSSTNVIPAGTPIVATRMSLGKIVRANFDSAINQDLKAIFLNNEINDYYFEYWYRSMAPTIESMGTGTTVKGIKLTQLHALNFMLPPLPEQKRIVEKLDSLLAQVDTIQQRLNNLPDIIKRFRQSVLAAAVSGKLTEQWREVVNVTPNEFVNSILLQRKALLKKKIAKDHTLEDSKIVADIPDSWVIQPLGKLTSYITSGSRGWSKFYSEDPKDAKFVRSAEINNDYLRLDEAITVKLPEKVEGKRSLIEKGDLLLTITGANVGKCAHIEKKIPEAYVSQSVALIKSIDPSISKFLHLWLKAKNAGGSQLEEMMYGIGRPVLSLPNIYSIRVGIPPFEEQTEIVRLVEQYFALADTLEKNLANAKQRVDNLTQSILAKAFKGELVPQDPSDEPADKLLARIKAARTKAEALEKAAKKAAKVSKMTKSKATKASSTKKKVDA